MKKRNDDGMGLIVGVVLAAFCLPLLGVYLFINARSDEDKVVGAVIAIVGVIIAALIFK